jgi:hypothetical protein
VAKRQPQMKPYLSVLVDVRWKLFHPQTLLVRREVSRFA